MEKRVGDGGVQMGGNDHGRMRIQDVKESWDSETLTDEGSSSQMALSFAQVRHHPIYM